MNSFLFFMIFMQVSIFFIAAILLAFSAYLVMKNHLKKAEVRRVPRRAYQRNRAMAI